MGADIYVMSEWNAREGALQARLDAIDENNVLDSARRVFEVTKEVCAGCYFRDASNAANLLSRVGLSWKRDIVPLLDGNGNLPLEHVKWLRNILATSKLDQFCADDTGYDLRRLTEDIEEQFGAIHDESAGEVPQQVFEGKRDQLLAVLDTSLKLGEPLYCSI